MMDIHRINIVLWEKREDGLAYIPINVVKTEYLSHWYDWCKDEKIGDEEMKPIYEAVKEIAPYEEVASLCEWNKHNTNFKKVLPRFAVSDFVEALNSEIRNVEGLGSSTKTTEYMFTMDEPLIDETGIGE